MVTTARSWDPLYGRLEMTPFECNLIALPEVQRLRYVRMCNINSLLVSGASEISRFEHTLGVMHLTKSWIVAHGIPESEGRDLIAAAALHDMQTGPFGHSMQYVLEDNTTPDDFVHEDIAHGRRSAYHQNTLASSSFSGRPFSAHALLGKQMESVAAIIRGEGQYGPLISGTMDLDNIDNVVRLAFHVGVATDADRTIPLHLAQVLNTSGGELVLPVNAIESVTRWQAIRTRLYSLLLNDWAEFSAKGMLTKAIEIAIKHDIIGTDSWLMTDAAFLDFLDAKGLGEAQETRELVRRLRRGDLYDPIALMETPDIDAYAAVSGAELKKSIEIELTRKSKRRGIRLLVHFILDKGKTERAIKVRLSDSSESIVIGHSSSRLLCGLFASHSRLNEPDREKLVQLFSDILKEHGIGSAVSIPDPMGESLTVSQLSLL